MGSEHGGLNYKELLAAGINPDDVLDFSVSINPDPLPHELLSAVRNSSITRYPDTNCTALRKSIGDYYSVDEDRLLVVNGTSQGMFLIASALLPSNGKVAIVGPTYGEYLDACRLKTKDIREIRMKAEDSFTFPVKDILSCLAGEKPDMLWICSPNNPTGTYLNEASFLDIWKSCRENDTLFILDEAYACFVEDRMRYNALKEGVIVMRSMTKDFSIPGLRLGYLMAEPDLIKRISLWQPDWSISSPAQDAGISGFRLIKNFIDSWKRTSERREEFRKQLQDLGLNVSESCANFFLVEIGNVEDLKRHLWKQLILVRDCRSFGLENMIRIGVRSKEENQRLISCIREYLES